MSGPVSHRQDTWANDRLLVIGLVALAATVFSIVAISIAAQARSSVIPAVSTRVQQDLRGPVACRVVGDTVDGKIALACTPPAGKR